MSDDAHSKLAPHLGLSAAEPPTIRAAFEPLPAGPEAIGRALAYTRELARSHYENFSVVSILLPKHLRQDFANVYAFCRVADDLGDEVRDRARATQLLADFEAQTRACYAGQRTTAVFIALWQTIEAHEIPIDPFLHLISAFQQDQRLTRYETYEQVLDYCKRSADPVGRLVLYMCGHRDAERQRLSDCTCSALQLTNFWQDIRRDFIERDRIYLPREDMARFHVTEEQIRTGRFDGNFGELIRFEVDRTEALFAQGDPLLPMLAPRYRRQIALFSAGGRAILESIRRQDYDTLSRRPSLSAWQKTRLLLRAAATLLTPSPRRQARA